MALPGVQRLDHIGFTVPNLAEAEDFLVNVLGCEYMYPLGPFVHEDSDWMLEHLNVHPRTVMRRLHFFRLGGQAVFEVFEYEAPDQQTHVPKNSDIGGHHVALYVDDLDAAVEYLKSKGVTVLGEPTVSKNASEGQRWVYFLAPWGMQFELVSYPNGMGCVSARVSAISLAGGAWQIALTVISIKTGETQKLNDYFT